MSTHKDSSAGNKSSGGPNIAINVQGINSQANGQHSPNDSKNKSKNKAAKEYDSFRTSASGKLSHDEKMEKNVAETRERIAALQQNVDTEIEKLDQKLDTVLEKNEKDFLTAYRFHMLKVQNELMQLKKKANDSELKSLQESKLAELDKEQHRFQMECMEVRKYCDDQEILIKKLDFKKQILLDDQDFLDFELRDGKEQNASLKLALSKNLTVLDEQNIDNENALLGLQDIIAGQSMIDDTNTMNFDQSLAEGAHMATENAQNQSFISSVMKGDQQHKQPDISGFQGSLMEKNTAADMSYQAKLQTSHLESSKRDGSNEPGSGGRQHATNISGLQGTAIANFDDSIMTSGINTQLDNSYLQPADASQFNLATQNQSREMEENQQQQTHDYQMLAAQQKMTTSTNSRENQQQFVNTGGVGERRQTDAFRSTKQSQETYGADHTSTASPHAGAPNDQGPLSQTYGRSYKYQPRFKRPYEEGQGPRDAQISQNYNQKLCTFIQDELDHCKVNHANHGIEEVTDAIEGYFKENLMRRFDQIQVLKQKIAQEQIKNMKREKVKEQLAAKYKQSQQSHKLVEVFKKCVQDTCKEKQALREQHGAAGNTLAGRKSLYVSKEDLTPLEKRRVLENFVENDDALGLLLDFISNKHMSNDGQNSKPGGMRSSDYLSNAIMPVSSLRSNQNFTQLHNNQQSIGSQLYGGFPSTQHSNSQMQMQQHLDGQSHTIYSTQYQLLMNIQNASNQNKLDGVQMQSQQQSLLQNHMLSNSFMNNAPVGRGPLGLGHHQTEKEMYAGTNLNKEQRQGLAGPIMIGETAASNLHNMTHITNLTNLQTQQQLQVSSTMGKNIASQLRDQGIIPGAANLKNLNNINSAISAGAPSPYDINQFNTNQQMYQSFVRGTLAKKRQSQFSERKAAKETERYQMQHNMAVRDFKDFADNEIANLQNMQTTHKAAGAAGKQTMGPGLVGLAKAQNQQMMLNVQLNQPSVMKNSTGIVSNPKVPTAQNQQTKVNPIEVGASSNAFSNTGKRVMNQI